MSIDSWNERFSIAGAAKFEAGEGGLARLVIQAAEGAATVYVHGAHVTHFQPRGADPVLWMSGSSGFAAGKAIRGGVPVIFPWFGGKADDPKAPAHGLVRKIAWDVAGVERLPDGRVQAVFRHQVDALTVDYHVTVGRELDLRMAVTNTGDKPASFEQALHTYLAVSDVRQVALRGLEGTTYIDKVDDFQRKTQPDQPIRIVGETDSVYLDTAAVVLVEDEAAGRTIAVGKTGSRSTVVWNPWVDKAAGMGDLCNRFLPRP